MDAPSPTALALVLPVKIRPLISLIGSLLGLKSRCATCDEKSGLPTRLSSGTWTICCPQCYGEFKLSEHIWGVHTMTTTARPSSIKAPTTQKANACSDSEEESPYVCCKDDMQTACAKTKKSLPLPHSPPPSRLEPTGLTSHFSSQPRNAMRCSNLPSMLQQQQRHRP